MRGSVRPLQHADSRLRSGYVAYVLVIVDALKPLLVAVMIQHILSPNPSSRHIGLPVSFPSKIWYLGGDPAAYARPVVRTFLLSFFLTRVVLDRPFISERFLTTLADARARLLSSLRQRFCFLSDSNTQRPPLQSTITIPRADRASHSVLPFSGGLVA